MGGQRDEKGRPFKRLDLQAQMRTAGATAIAATARGRGCFAAHWMIAVVCVCVCEDEWEKDELRRDGSDSDQRAKRRQVAVSERRRWQCDRKAHAMII